MLEARKKTNNLTLLYTTIYPHNTTLRLKIVYLFAWYFFRVKK